MLLLINVALIILFISWIASPWEHIYMVGESRADSIKYNELSIFKTPLRKIYRAKKFSSDKWDIFLLYSFDRFSKKIVYKMVDMQDEDIEILNKANNGESGV